jgi:transposase-like protein
VRRKQYLSWTDEAVMAGARQEKVAQELELSTRTLRRWRDEEGQVLQDNRQIVVRPEPKKTLYCRASTSH